MTVLAVPNVPNALAALPPEARPREKLIARGAAALADAELLAILLRTGRPGRPVLSLSREVLDRCGGLRALLRAEGPSLEGIKGLGPSKRTTLLAVLEIARRALRTALADGPVFESASAVRDYLRLEYDALRAECFGVMFLDTRHRLIALETLFQGTLSHTIAYPREVVKRALALNAAAVILVHNHPSGHTDPSPEDLQLTRVMIQALALVDVKVLDHFIVGAGDAVPLTDLGLL
ncbi:DNA repair protein RadC [Mitsuaria sp. GD03876]|uniref:RadC family protein n=1 Tax=Mitsuaria sp. GD03876 TaxID=2975399 RepID=UPI0024490D96|nr:DNA repair protein RadC [Mitsuaria sp. GD03876]MDH0864687.1 DNA repair protein RadC [Mitsuaria sp. GD03876]